MDDHHQRFARVTGVTPCPAIVSCLGAREEALLRLLAVMKPSRIWFSRSRAAPGPLGTMIAVELGFCAKSFRVSMYWVVTIMCMASWGVSPAAVMDSMDSLTPSAMAFLIFAMPFPANCLAS